MKKEEFIEKHSEEEYESYRDYITGWKKSHLTLVQANAREQNRKGGKFYKEKKEYKMTGIQHIKEIIRNKYRNRWKQFKQIIAPESQIHHEWLPGTADYRGVALVEKDQHLQGFIDVIQILEGRITLFTEAEIRSRELAI